MRVSRRSLLVLGLLLLMFGGGVLFFSAAGSDDPSTEIAGLAHIDERGVHIYHEQRVAPGEGRLVLRLSLPDGYMINELAPSLVTWRGGGAVMTLAPEDQSRSLAGLPAVDGIVALSVPASFAVGTATFEGVIEVYYCETDEKLLCVIDRARVRVPLVVSEVSESESLVVHRDIRLPDTTG